MKSLGQVAFEAATAVSGGDGVWDEVPQFMWDAAAEAVRRAVLADEQARHGGQDHEQRWHVSWFAVFPDRETAYGDGIYSVAYGFTDDTLPQLRSLLAESAREAEGLDILPERIGIMGLSRVS